MLHANGSYRWVLCRGIAIKDEQGKVYRLTGSQTDITESQMAVEKLHHDALHDRLTGLPNRSFFIETNEQFIQLEIPAHLKITEQINHDFISPSHPLPIPLHPCYFPRSILS